LDNLAETVFTSGSSYANVYNAFDFVRLIKFFDNSIFRIIKDFVPARSNVDTGIVIKPHILDRSKIKQPEVKWSNQTSPSFDHASTQLDYTGSYYTSNFSLEGDISTAFITGSSGLDNKYTSSYTETYANPSGGLQTLTRNNHDEASFTGEFSGSILRVSNGDLTAGNTFKKLEPEQFSFKYIPRNDFTSNSSLLQTYESTVNMDLVSSSIDSPDQSSEGPLTLALNVQNVVDYTGDFRLTGGPNYDSPQPDSGSAYFIFDESLLPGDTLAINLSTEFANLNDLDMFITTGGSSTVLLEIVSSSVVVASRSLQRPTTSESTQATVVSFKNETGTSISPPGDITPAALANGLYYRIKYSSNLESISSVNFIDASFTATPTIRTFDPDAITLWLQEVPSTETEFTSSFVKAMTVPLTSTTNGGMVPYLREASEVVFQYPGFSIDSYDSSAITSSVEGGAYKASITVDDNDIFLTHITSAPYSASFTQPLPDLVDGKNLQFNFTVDFDSYWSTYLNTYTFADTTFVTASIRNSNTGVVTGSLNFQIQQGQYPNEYKRSLVYENTTGGTLSDLEFYYQVNIPKSKGAGFPKVNLKNVQINYRTPQVEGISSKILSGQKLKNSYFLELQDVEVTSGSLAYFEPTTDYYSVGFIAGESELFKFNDYASISNNIDSVRRSTTRLVVDEKTYTPTQGSYRGFFLPANYAILSSSIANGVEGLDPRFFAEIQDSNYYATGWKNGRYDGTEATNRRRGVRVLGLEPSVNYDSFTGYRFLDSATTASIRDLVASVGDAAGEERQDLTIYYNKYESKLLGDVLIEFESVGGRGQGTATLNSSTINSFGVTVDGLSQGLYNWSGSIGEYIDGGRVVVDFNVTYDFWTDDEISGSLAPVSPGTRTPGEFTIYLIDLDNGGIALDSINTLFSDGVFVGKPSGYGDEYNYTFILQSDVVSKNVAIKFFDDNLYEESGGTTGVTFDFNSIKKSNFIPVNNPSSSIVAQTPEVKTFFYEEVTPTPSSPNGFQTITNSKIYRLDTDEILTTNDLGIVTNIE